MLRGVYRGRPAHAHELWLHPSDWRHSNEGPMIEIAEITTSGTIRLPAGLASRFRKTDRFVVWTDGDTVHLKRITPRSLTKAVESAPEEPPMSMPEVSEIVHAVRAQRRPR